RSRRDPRCPAGRRGRTYAHTCPVGAQFHARPDRRARGRRGRLSAQAVLAVHPARHEVRRGETAVDLTPVEFKLLSAILAADGRVLTRDQLLDAVYGHESSDVLDRTIDVHVRRLRDKLDDDPDAPRYVQTVRGVGYRAART